MSFAEAVAPQNLGPMLPFFAPQKTLSGQTELERTAIGIRGRADFGGLCSMHIECRASNHKVYRDYGRLIARRKFSLLAMHVYATAIKCIQDESSSPPLKDIKQFNTINEFVSHNSVRAWIHLAEYAGYIQLTCNPDDRRSKILLPTSAFHELIRKYIRAQNLTRIIPLQPELFEKLLHDSNFVCLLLENIVARNREFCEICSQFEWANKLNDNISGLDILFYIRNVTNCGQAQFSYAEIASKFKVSRNHVRNIIDTAQTYRLITIDGVGGRRIHVNPRYFEQIDAYISLKLALYVTSFAEARRLAANRALTDGPH